ncbi:siphovirus ReqiPepy6 Gp37-like family protein [Kitasatospora sp. NBC_01302]|uniref:siphovirus ReqiPepy6 Gp37-like family protein n=1 Tax=Kitasatospora sp. NBC_01302 TaxID=2903575 RepID=UPI002E15183A|nr:siphovirus ReqiPepy6 Gp37-like family protein [Kitasatospora sp. NBC_01302]
MRDKALARQGVIRPEELVLELQDTFNNVGTWKLSLAAEHPLTTVLRTPGSGIIVTGPTDVLMSGPTVKSELASTPDDPAGTVSFEGVSDSITLSDTLAWPEPSNPDASAQKVSHDIRTGPAETLMQDFVNANCGQYAPAARRKAGLRMGGSLGRGATLTKKARFPVLGDLLSEIALVAGLGFRIVQRGNQLVFETYQVTDRSKTIRLDARNRTLSGQRVAISPPGVTRVLVAGQGDLTNRQFLQVDDATSVAAEADWGRRIEKFVDQRNTNDVTELKQAGTEALADSGFTGIAVQAVPVEDSTMRFGIEWYLGDRVGVVVEGQELASTVTGMLLKANADGFKVGALLGDPAGFTLGAALTRHMQTTDARVSALERTAEATPAGPRVLAPSAITQSSPESAYPLGASVTYLTGDQATAGGWDFGGRYGFLFTQHQDTGDISQRWSRVHANTTTHEEYYRGGNRPSGWGPWRAATMTTLLNPDGARTHQRSQNQLTGGGRIYWDGNGFSWSTRFIAISIGRGSWAPDGYFDISMPPDGTVIPVVGHYGATSVTVTGGRINISGLTRWAALWYKIPYGSGSASNPANFLVTGYTAGAPAPPDDCVLVAAFNSDGWGAPSLKLGTGELIDHWRNLTLQNSWVNFDSNLTATNPDVPTNTWSSAAFRKLPGGQVEVKGLIKGGLCEQERVIATLPAGYRPAGRRIFMAPNNGAAMRLDVDSAGDIFVRLDGGVGTVNNGWLDLGCLRFSADS